MYWKPDKKNIQTDQCSENGTLLGAGIQKKLSSFPKSFCHMYSVQQEG